MNLLYNKPVNVLINQILRVINCTGCLKSARKYIFDYRYNYMHFQYSKRGATIGNNTVLLDVSLSSSSKGDEFHIGDNCTLTGCTLLGHDASPTLFIRPLVQNDNPLFPGARKSYRNPICIGDNVFIGANSTVLPGVTIGSNIVIGAGSVVTKDVPDNVVVAGNPAKIVKTIHEFKKNYSDLYEKYPGRF